MDPVSFKAALQDAKPDMASLLDIGLESSEAEELLSSFDIGEREITEYFPLSDPTLAELFSRNDVSRVEIGMVKLQRDPQNTAFGWLIGEVEADYLALDTASGEIVVIDITSPDHVIWRCAREGSGFLGALAIAAKYLGDCLHADQTGTAAQLAAFTKCVDLSGGDSYAAFYKMILGVD
jgi:hypothetical protein